MVISMKSGFTDLSDEDMSLFTIFFSSTFNLFNKGRITMLIFYSNIND